MGASQAGASFGKTNSLTNLSLQRQIITIGVRDKNLGPFLDGGGRLKMIINSKVKMIIIILHKIKK